jgi:hypothetical protein
LYSNDESISGLVEEFAMNDIIVVSAMINKLREIFPTIDFFTRSEDKNQSNYNEWMYFDVVLSGVSSNIFHNRVLDSKQYGKYWTTTTNVNFEYTTNDIETLLARRDEYRVGKFLMDLKTFPVQVGSKEFQCSIFWDRNTLGAEYQVTTNKDISGTSQFTYEFTCTVIYTNLEYKQKPITMIEEVIYSIINKEWEEDEVVLVDKGIDTSNITDSLIL